MTDRINQLEAAVRSTLDWQERVRGKPWLYVGIALAAGFLVAGGPKRGITHAYRAIRGSTRGTLALPELPAPKRAPKKAPEPSTPFPERLALRLAESAATAAAAILTNRLLQEMSGEDAAKR